MQSLLRTSFPRFMTGMFVALFALTFSSSVFADPTSVVTNPGGNGNPSCAFLGFSGELKVDPPNPGKNELIPFEDDQPNDIFLTGDPNSNLFLNYTVSANGRVLTSWSIVGQYDRLVHAVVVKGGPGGANVYYYEGGSAGDSDTAFTVPGGANAISHISFCTDDFTAPSPVMNFKGRVTDKKGKPLAGALVTVTDAILFTTYTFETDANGYYETESVFIQEAYYITASHSRYKFPTFFGFAEEGEATVDIRAR